MGLTVSSTGAGAADSGPSIQRTGSDRVIALAGNPNVGKSTLFNALTGLNQHTGNWPGKTVATAQGRHTHGDTGYVLVDLPGTYSLMAHSAEEEVARDFICFGGADATVVVCDATCLERNLNLVLQTLEITGRVVVCVNLMDEAARKGIRVDLDALQDRLGVPVVAAVARAGRGLDTLMDRVEEVAAGRWRGRPMAVPYPAPVREALAMVEPLAAQWTAGRLNPRWAALRLLEGDPALTRLLAHRLGGDAAASPSLFLQVERARALLEDQGIPPGALADRLVGGIVQAAEETAARTVRWQEDCLDRDRRLDRIFTSRRTGIPVMILLLGVVLWLTIAGANAPSALLSRLLFGFQGTLDRWVLALGAPEWLRGALVDGVYRVLSWVVAVMLPPMAIFFPLFTLLEDFGYLPRVAFNLDHAFQKCRACGKQALTMWVGSPGMRMPPVCPCRGAGQGILPWSGLGKNRIFCQKPVL